MIDQPNANLSALPAFGEETGAVEADESSVEPFLRLAPQALKSSGEEDDQPVPGVGGLATERGVR